jgi:hypothetical protein
MGLASLDVSVLEAVASLPDNLPPIKQLAWQKEPTLKVLIQELQGYSEAKRAGKSGGQTGGGGGGDVAPLPPGTDMQTMAPAPLGADAPAGGGGGGSGGGSVRMVPQEVTFGQWGGRANNRTMVLSPQLVKRLRRIPMK